MTFDTSDELPHRAGDRGLIDEWIFAAWQPRGDLGIVSGHRLFHDRSWYWCALVEAGRPLLHLAEWQVAVRAHDPFIVKAPEMWAEHQMDEPMEQWSIGNEAYFVALDDPDDALGRAYGKPTPIAMDLEWYATAPPSAIEHGYEQVGVVHGEVELLHQPNLQLVEVPAHRWRRWGTELPPLTHPPKALTPPEVTVAHDPGSVRFGAAASPYGDMRAPFAFPDGTVAEWSLTAAGWAAGSGSSAEGRTG